MNANELAYELEADGDKEAANMIRQQQAKIIYLETALALEGIVPNYELFELLEKAKEK